MINRRNFLKAGFLSSCVFVMGGCELFSITTPTQTIKTLQYDLFPYAKKLNVDLNKYFQIILNHSRIDEDEKKHIKNGVKWLNEEAVKLFKKTYTKLDSLQRQKVLILISQTRWGERWIKTMLTYIMEAVFSDSIYNVSSELGWEWLNFK
ncbi:MAG: gluconate 2-dehydrogenase subunit 3 family protein, partial [Sulfurimonas sp.]|nr:gluconate 2-dehydrogenase subunit 3 family protein [Sulfurimonas sp.]